jgi:hypothetical protein
VGWSEVLSLPVDGVTLLVDMMKEQNDNKDWVMDGLEGGRGELYSGVWTLPGGIDKWYHFFLFLFGTGHSLIIHCS